MSCQDAVKASVVPFFMRIAGLLQPSKREQSSSDIAATICMND